MLKVQRFMIARPRMTVAVLLGLLAYASLPDWLSQLSQLLIGWNITSWFYLLSMWVLILSANPERIKAIARLQDESAAKVLITGCIAALVSLVAIVLELANAKDLHGLPRLWHLALSGSTLLAAWLLIPTLFTVHYAHVFYGSRTDTRPLLFPDRIAQPNYWDFAYFSFTIAGASQTADIALNNSRMRRLVLAQSVLSFLFNTSIVAMSINVAASLIN